MIGENASVSNTLYSKYRPLTFDEVVGQDHIVRILANSILKDTLVHAYLFSGIRGVGKTTVARILARYLNCTQPNGYNPCNECSNCLAILRGGGAYPDVEEIDAASNRGVDDARKLREGLIFKPQNGHRVIIIDEAHQLTPEASQALLKTFEEPPEKTTFVLCTTELDQILDTIRSRCQCLPFKPINVSNIKGHLFDIAKNEKWNISEAVIHAIASSADGSLRDAISQLNKLSSVIDDGGNISDDDAFMLLGLMGRECIHSYLFALLNSDIESVFILINDIIDGGYDPRAFLRNAMMLIKDVMCVQVCGDYSCAPRIMKEEREIVTKIINKANSLSILNIILFGLDECYDKIVSRKNLPPDISMVETSMKIMSKIALHNKRERRRQ